jgi:hypothetical protein
MTIEEMQIIKADLEKRIASEISLFASETFLKVSDLVLEVQTVKGAGGAEMHRSYRVHIKVEL